MTVDNVTQIITINDLIILSLDATSLFGLWDFFNLYIKDRTHNLITTGPFLYLKITLIMAMIRHVVSL